MTDPAALYARLNQAFNQRAWPQAKQIAAQLLPLAPRHPGVHYIAGIACMELQEVPAGVEFLRRAALLEPTRAEFLVQYAKALTRTHRNRDAKAVADQALALKPADPAALDSLGVIYTQVGEYGPATDMFRQASALAPHHAPFRFNLATSLVTAGDLDAAESEFEACLASDPHHWLAHLTLAQLRRQTPDSHHVERLESLLQQSENHSAEASMCVNMALAKEYEDLADYSRSFDHLVRGKTAGATGRDYTIERDEALFSAITAAFPAPQSFAGQCASNEPIFIIGMPRSGTTLVERIISSHPDVQSAGELLNFGMSVKHVSGSRTVPLIDETTIKLARDADLSRLGTIYLDSTRPVTGAKPKFIDKLPHNFLYAGFIANALPNARIVCLRRDPMDTCLSNFRQLFGVKSPFFDYSFDLLDTGRYYILFDRLMAHWQQVLPGRILEIDYETLVGSQEASSRRLLEFCGLSWHEDCLSFQSNPTPVATASAVQVREPLYRSAIKRWKKYGGKLDELQTLLTGAGIELKE